MTGEKELATERGMWFVNFSFTPMKCTVPVGEQSEWLSQVKGGNKTMT